MNYASFLCMSLLLYLIPHQACSVLLCNCISLKHYLGLVLALHVFLATHMVSFGHAAKVCLLLCCHWERNARQGWLTAAGKSGEIRRVPFLLSVATESTMQVCAG